MDVPGGMVEGTWPACADGCRGAGWLDAGAAASGDGWLAAEDGTACDACGAVGSAGAAGCCAASEMAHASESNVTARKRIGAEIVSQRGGGCRFGMRHAQQNKRPHGDLAPQLAVDLHAADALHDSAMQGLYHTG